ncbi:MAG: peptide deformylase [Mogibacterium sp.]|nr:peptide deformylase [Mogibacterium sp.]
MIKPIVRDIFFLRQKSEPAGRADLAIAQDLEDTLRANRGRCVGMAANMIGYRRRIIVVNAGLADLVMINPVITAKSGPFETEEGCLSLDGVRRTTRYERITVEYQDKNMVKKTQEFSGWTAQIIQHECDHLEGILI